MRIFQSLADRGRTLQRMGGHQEEAVRFVYRIQPGGDLVSVTSYPPKEHLRFVPQPPPGANLIFATAVASFQYTFGLVDGAPDARTQTKHQAYCDLLSEIGTQAARAVCSFVQGAHARFVGQGSAYLPDGAKPSDKVLIEVEGHPDWWLDPEAVRLHQQRVAARNTRGGDEVRGQCACCGLPDQPIARVWPESAYGALVSRNDPTLEGHGWSGSQGQAYGVHYCVTCAAEVVSGYTDLCQKASRYHRAGDVRLLWWTPRGSPPLWDLLADALNPEESARVRGAAIQQIEEAGPTTFLMVQKNMARAAIRAWGEPTGAQVAARVRAFRNVFPDLGVDPGLKGASGKKAHPARILPRSLCEGGDDPSREGTHLFRWARKILLRIILNEAIAPWELRQLSALETQDPGGLKLPPSRRPAHIELCQRRAAFVAWHQGSFMAPTEVPPRPTLRLPPGVSEDERRFAEAIGRAFAHAVRAQRRQNPRIQRSIEERLVPGASGSVQALVELIHQHGVYRAPNGQNGILPKVREYMKVAGESGCLGQTRLRPKVVPLLIAAYWQEQGQIDAEWRKAKEAQNDNQQEKP